MPDYERQQALSSSVWPTVHSTSTMHLWNPPLCGSESQHETVISVIEPRMLSVKNSSLKKMPDYQKVPTPGAFYL
jgi:hypothetical protein